MTGIDLLEMILRQPTESVVRMGGSRSTWGGLEIHLGRLFFCMEKNTDHSFRKKSKTSYIPFWCLFVGLLKGV